ncbi:MAG: AAA family ATPase [Janthinobacterium lividum]
MKLTDIKNVRIEGLHGQYKFDLSLKPGLNILYGFNGTGKTTLLHILANLIDRDVERFCHLRFDSIAVETYSQWQIELRQRHQNETGMSVIVTINGSEVATISEGTETPPTLRELLKENLGGRPVYLPAFRSVLEAVNQNDYQRYRYVDSEAKQALINKIVNAESQDEKDDFRLKGLYVRTSSRIEQLAYKTVLCRDWFGDFVPVIRCPSLWEVADQLSSEQNEAERRVASTDREAFRSVFYRILQSILEPSLEAPDELAEAMLHRIADNLVQLEQNPSERGNSEENNKIATLLRSRNQSVNSEDVTLTSILQVYDNAIRTRKDVQEQAFSQLSTFEDSVNQFLLGKKLDITRQNTIPLRTQRGKARMISISNERKAPLGILSSGERQVVTLLFSATHMSATDGIVLIDEPELSLHVDWQRIILREMTKQAGDRQIIACTHAPEVAADHRRVMVRLSELEVKESTSDDAAIDEQTDFSEVDN